MSKYALTHSLSDLVQESGKLQRSDQELAGAVLRGKVNAVLLPSRMRQAAQDFLGVSICIGIGDDLRPWSEGAVVHRAGHDEHRVCSQGHGSLGQAFDDEPGSARAFSDPGWTWDSATAPCRRPRSRACRAPRSPCEAGSARSHPCPASTPATAPGSPPRLRNLRRARSPRGAAWGCSSGNMRRVIAFRMEDPSRDHPFFQKPISRSSCSSMGVMGCAMFC